MKNTIKAFSVIILSLFLFPNLTFAQGQYVDKSIGIDVSYPNCSSKLPTVSFGIVGVTGGLVYSQNNCLADEAKNFSNLSLYVNTGLNASLSSPYYTEALASCEGDASCAAKKYGYNAGLDAVNYAKSQGINVATTWWLDVETENSWTNDYSQNIQSLQGEIEALKASGATMVGVYSTTFQWNEITGGWKNGLPSWGATAWTTSKQALSYCSGHEFTGGPSYLMQYKPARSSVDYDVACPVKTSKTRR